MGAAESHLKRLSQIPSIFELQVFGAMRNAQRPLALDATAGAPVHVPLVQTIQAKRDALQHHERIIIEPCSKHYGR